MKIKICGLFREQDIEYVNEARPDYCGFVFAESKRKVSPVQAAKLRQRLMEGITTVGVFINAPIEEITALYRDHVIDIAQLHGNEEENYITQLKQASGSMPIPIIQVIKSEILSSLSPCNSVSSVVYSSADYFLIDSGAGSGETFNWGLLKSPVSSPCSLFNKPWFLAGGINLANIKQAMALNPFAIDVSSGAETDGVKDREKIVQLVATARKGNIP